MSAPFLLIVFGLVAGLPLLGGFLAALMYYAARAEAHGWDGVSSFDDGCYDRITGPETPIHEPPMTLSAGLSPD